jgi:anhydro-N-acetylmuramic acid kinase
LPAEEQANLVCLAAHVVAFVARCYIGLGRPYRGHFRMSDGSHYTSIGLMSGTSMDASDVALLQTDGESVLRAGPWMSRPYPTGLREALLGLATDAPDLPGYEAQVTQAHIDLVRDFCSAQHIDRATIDCIGFHGQTIKHEPHLGRTWQLGDGARMARELGCVVINRFRDEDLRCGGQGAPFAPAYHRALTLAHRIEQPVAVLNIGGVSNVTLISGDDTYACDCGPGNALIDDWVRARADVAYDEGGRLAASGSVDTQVLADLMNHPYFEIRGAKSLDRNHFSLEPVTQLSVADGAATLVAFTARAIASAARMLPVQAHTWVVVGGGRLNRTLVSRIQVELSCPVLVAEDLGWSGDAIEAQAFAYLAVRALRGLPLSWPTTTGVREPTSGGVRHMPNAA